MHCGNVYSRGVTLTSPRNKSRYCVEVSVCCMGGRGCGFFLLDSLVDLHVLHWVMVVWDEVVVVLAFSKFELRPASVVPPALSVLPLQSLFASS